ncbi:MAG TPA: hypothetical protein VMI11_13890 [Actinomycetes bacterium]|nr:hypothetical protein [Actinomycetes bacterium]
MAAVAAAYVPSPPLLHPDVGTGPDPQLEALRAACHRAVGGLVDGGPSGVVVLGDLADRAVLAPAAPPGGQGGHARADETSAGTFAPWGVDVRVGAVGVAPSLGLAHSIGAWLLDAAGWTGPRSYVAPGDLDALPEGAALLVVADGSATRTPKAPGSYDPAGEAFDARVRAALASGDPGRLAALPAEAARAVLAQGVPAWHEAARLLDGRTYRAEVLADSAPFGVGYLVAVWSR